MIIDNATFGVYAEYWQNWFGKEKPRSVKGTEIIRLSHEWKLPLDYLMEQVFLLRYDILDEDTSVAYAGGYDRRKHTLNEYIPKYCKQIFEKPSKNSIGNVFYFQQDQLKGLDNMVFRIQPRPIQGYRTAFVKRVERWIKAANHWTNNGYVDGYKAKILEVHQPEVSKRIKKGRDRNRPCDYVMIQVPREYANIMIADGYFPSEFESITSSYAEWPKKWTCHIDPAIAEEVRKKRMAGLANWLFERSARVAQQRAEDEAKRSFERYMNDKRKTGVKPYDYYKYSWATTVIM